MLVDGFLVECAGFPVHANQERFVAHRLNCAAEMLSDECRDLPLPVSGLFNMLRSVTARSRTLFNSSMSLTPSAAAVSRNSLSSVSRSTSRWFGASW